MATVTLKWKKQDTVIPNAASFNQYDAQILNQADNSVVADLTIPLGTFSAVFMNIPAGDYIGSVSIMDNAGNLGAPPTQAPFTVPAEPTAPVPTEITVELS